ncbi:MAG: rhodanese-like domain-containing protein [Coriobacteriia bacterium]|nr:rhodanese-like domain-containing protein [Coriobacteriia bacterium]
MPRAATALTSDQLEKRIEADRDITVIDIRTKGEFDRGHIKNAYHLLLGPFDTISDAMGIPDGDVAIVCFVGFAGKRVATDLAKRREGVYYLKGGTNAWYGDLVSEKITPPAPLVRGVMLVQLILLAAGIALMSFVSYWWGVAIIGLVTLDAFLGAAFNKSTLVTLLRAFSLR